MLMDAVESVWKDRTLVRWVCTQWCNYSCSYCNQEHSRKQTYRGKPGHWADNASVDCWLTAFNAIPNLSLIITGGEPFVDRKSMKPFLEGLAAASVKIDTNGSWDPYEWKPPKCDPLLLVSYHPEQVHEDFFFHQLRAISLFGWRIGAVNVVAKSGQLNVLPRLQARCNEAGTVLSVLPLDGNLNSYTPNEQLELRNYIPCIYADIRTGSSPMGKPCLHPSVAYKVYPDGSAEVGCYPRKIGSVFDGLPKRLHGYTPCPHSSCFCIEKFSFLQELSVNLSPMPMVDYARRLL